MLVELTALPHVPRWIISVPPPEIYKFRLQLLRSTSLAYPLKKKLRKYTQREREKESPETCVYCRWKPRNGARNNFHSSCRAILHRATSTVSILSRRLRYLFDCVCVCNFRLYSPTRPYHPISFTNRRVKIHLVFFKIFLLSQRALYPNYFIHV
jgi:hypothetical protein